MHKDGWIRKNFPESEAANKGTLSHCKSLVSGTPRRVLHHYVKEEGVSGRRSHKIISASTPRVIPTALPQCPPLFASQQSLNRWCSARESSDSHRLATNRLLGNQLTRPDSARCCHIYFPWRRSTGSTVTRRHGGWEPVSGFPSQASMQNLTMRLAKVAHEFARSGCNETMQL